jgi:DNA-binding transcriptional MerR regulator
MRTERRQGALTIGKLAGAAGLTVEGVRYYERQGLLDPPARSAAGYRLYPPDALTRLTFIRQAKAMGLSLKEIRQILALSRAGVRPCEEVRAFMRRKLAELDRTIRDVKALRQRLNDTLARWEGLPEAPRGGHVCDLIEQAAGRADEPAAVGRGASRIRTAGAKAR